MRSRIIANFLAQVPARSILIPLAAVVLWIFMGHEPGWFLLALAGAGLLGSVMVAVYHAELIAHRIGEPFGALLLALSVTIIEVSLIVSIMLSEHVDSSGLARDTVFATVMIVCNGVVGLCLLIGALKHNELGFRIEGTTPALAVLVTLATMTLVLPDFTFSTDGPTFSPSQLVFAAVVSLSLYGVFLFVQTIRHREYFLPQQTELDPAHHSKPKNWVAWVSVGLLIVSLIAVVGLAESLAPAIEKAIHRAGLPHAVLGIIIALMVLLPETTTAVRAAQRNQMQISFNLALGSGLATIGLTIPAVVTLSLLLDLPMNLGLDPKEVALLVLTFFLTFTTLSGGRATILQGTVHLVVFAIFVFLTVIP